MQLQLRGTTQRLKLVLWFDIVLGCQKIGLGLRLLGNGADGWTFKGKIGSSKGFFFFFFFKNGFVLGLIGQAQVMYRVRSYALSIAKRSVLGL